MEGGFGFPLGGDPEDLMRGLREFAERQTEAMQESQREQFATLTLNTAVELTGAGAQADARRGLAGRAGDRAPRRHARALPRGGRARLGRPPGLHAGAVGRPRAVPRPRHARGLRGGGARAARDPRARRCSTSSRSRSQHGREAGLVSMLGVQTGGLVHVARRRARALGAARLSSAVAFNVVKFAGAAYLIFLGLRKLLSRERFETTGRAAAAPARPALRAGDRRQRAQPEDGALLLRVPAAVRGRRGGLGRAPDRRARRGLHPHRDRQRRDVRAGRRARPRTGSARTRASCVPSAGSRGRSSSASASPRPSPRRPAGSSGATPDHHPPSSVQRTSARMARGSPESVRGSCRLPGRRGP